MNLISFFLALAVLVVTLGDAFQMVSLLAVNPVSAGRMKRDLNWNGNNWALGCDFPGNDLSNAQIRGEDCGGRCAATQGCTHFTWTSWNGGTCWMKQGSVSKEDARSTGDNTMVCGVIESPVGGVNWNGNNWALGCDFPGNDLSNAQIRGEDCGGRCAATQGCSHFTWTSWNGGTCWMKQGPVSKNQAVATNDNNMVCGVISDSPGPGSSPNLGPVLSGVLATRHGANEAGACALPAANYAVVYPVALGSIDSLKHLKFRPELCGQVLQVNCGFGSLDIIVSNSNYGGGLDLYASTWSRLTNNKPPGETSCTVQLTSHNAFNFDGPRCYYKPGTGSGNPYYHNVGLLNTNGRIVTGAMMDNRPGAHRGDNPYYAFDFGPLDGNKQVKFTFQDGTSYSVFLRDCIDQPNEQMWS